jgi:hypothetical protein
MNDKLRALAVQSQMVFLNDCNKCVSSFIEDTDTDITDYVEKFAELILKEVFNACDMCEPQANPEYVLCEMFGIDHNWRLLDE